MYRYITFGQVHRHEVGGKFFDKDCIARVGGESIDEVYANVRDSFGVTYATSYSWEDLQNIITLFPRGVIPLKEK